MKKLLGNLPSDLKRLIKLAFDAAALTLSLYGAYLLRFNFSIPPQFQPLFGYESLFLICITLLSLIVFHSYRGMWRYTGLNELKSLSLGLFFGIVMSAFIDYIALDLDSNIPRSIYVLYGALGILILGLGRVLYRVIGEYGYSLAVARKATLLVGAHENCVSLIKAFPRSLKREAEVIGFATVEEPNRKQTALGIPVLGGVDDLEDIFSRHPFQQLIIVNHDQTGELVRNATKRMSDKPVAMKIIPTISRILSGETIDSRIRNLQVEDLLDRQPVELDLENVRRMFTGKRVLITGAGGSIGSELAKQVVACRPEKIILVDNSEFQLYSISSELTDSKSEISHHAYLADVRDVSGMRSIMESEKPHIILHAAAYKHVPLLESNSFQALSNNVGSTLNMVDLAMEANVERFVLISTDKAVNPSSVMGATKRAAELVCQAANLLASTQFIIVRFGNVIASNGSVVPRLINQIERGGPITITHPEITRYFLSITEASRLVLKAASFAECGEIFVLDMGEPIKIIDLARVLVRMNGKIPDEDIAIKIIGLRPGEKMHEELFYRQEDLSRTEENRILVARSDDIKPEYIEKCREVIKHTKTSDAATVRKILAEMVPSYRSPADIHPKVGAGSR